jgi:DNA-binding response OmpR family regulator
LSPLDELGFVKAAREELKSTVTIIIVATEGAEADRDKGLQLGTDAYLTKPINGAQGVKTVSELSG